jgi:hypothetical protein
MQNKPIFAATRNTPFTPDTPVGTKTNWGIFLGFDEHGSALFSNNGFVGKNALKFVQVLPITNDEREKVTGHADVADYGPDQ